MRERPPTTIELVPGEKRHLPVAVSIPYGSARGQLPVFEHPELGPYPIVPSFGIGSHADIWVIDVVGERVPHVSRSGRFLGEIEIRPRRSLPARGGRWFAESIELRDHEALLVSQHSWTVEARLTVLGQRGKPRSSPVELDGDAVAITYLLSGVAEPTGWVGGYAEVGGHELGSGPRGFARCMQAGPRCSPARRSEAPGPAPVA